MRRTLLRWLAPLLVGACFGLSPAPAQAPAPKSAPEQAPAGDLAALPYAAAALFTILILLIVCKPTRKGWKG